MKVLKNKIECLPKMPNFARLRRANPNSLSNFWLLKKRQSFSPRRAKYERFKLGAARESHASFILLLEFSKKFVTKKISKRKPCFNVQCFLIERIRTFGNIK